MKLLIVANADVHARDRLGRTPLMLASTNAKETNVQLLLAARADSDTTDKKGWTCIMHACREDRQLNVQLLLMDGADPAAGSEDGWTPLSVASQYAHLRRAPRTAAYQRLYHGCSLRRAHDRARCRRSYGRKDCTKYLLAAGADRKKTNEKHETAWDLAKKQAGPPLLGAGPRAAFPQSGPRPSDSPAPPRFPPSPSPVPAPPLLGATGPLGHPQGARGAAPQAGGGGPARVLRNPRQARPRVQAFPRQERRGAPRHRSSIYVAPQPVTAVALSLTPPTPAPP